MARFRGGSNPLNLPAPSGGVTVGTIVLVGELLVFAQSSAPAGELFTALREGIIVEAPAATQAWNQVGEALYWDNSNTRFTKTAGSHHFAGWVYRTKASGLILGSIVLDYTHAT